MSALRITPGGSAEGRDRLWRFLNVVLVAGSVAATVLALGVVIALFLWLYTLSPVESVRATSRNPPPRQMPPAPQAPEPAQAAAASPPAAAPPAAAAPTAAAPAEPAPPEAAEPALSEGGRRSRRAARRVAQPPGDPGAPAE